MATAIALRRRDPGAAVAVLEVKTVGYGASGRNGSFAMTVTGLGFSTTAMLRGKGFVRRAHGYMEQCVDRLEEFIDEAGLDCAKIRPGFLRVATTPAYVKRLQKQVRLMSSLGFEGIESIDAGATRKMVNSERYLGAMWEPRLLLMNPARLVRAEKRHAITLGAGVYENSPVLAVVKIPGKPGGYRLLAEIFGRPVDLASLRVGVSSSPFIARKRAGWRHRHIRGEGQAGASAAGRSHRFGNGGGCPG